MYQRARQPRGSATRSVTLIKVEPLPEGTTDFDILEAGWEFVDEEKIVVYGAIAEAGYGAYEYYIPYFRANTSDWAGLALWCDMTEDWLDDEGSSAPRPC